MNSICHTILKKSGYVMPFPSRGISVKVIYVIAFTLFTTLSYSYAQDLEKKITLKVTDIPLCEVLDQITLQTGVLFSYNPRRIPSGTKVTLDVNGFPVSTVLNKLFTPLKITYTVSGHHVILKSDKRSASQPSSGDKYTVSGFIRDSLTGEVLAGCSVYDTITLQGTVTNPYGYYSLTLPAGQYSIKFSSVGYKPEIHQIDLTSGYRLDHKLQEAALEIPGVVITNINKQLPGSQVTGSDFELPASTLRRMAGFAGNTDVIRSLHSLPGINAFGDGSAFFYVRGGEKDQNLMLLDEAPIFNPSHLLGFFSALSPSAIRDVKVYKGDIPASFGGRLSSVIDIHARDGNINNYEVAANIGIYTTDATLEGPLIKDKSSFIFSVRGSNIDWLTKSVSNDDKSLDISFYDLNAKFNISLNRRNRLYFTLFSGLDDLSRYTKNSVNTFGLAWFNTAAILRWNHLFNSKFFLNTTLLSSKYKYYMYLSREKDNYWESSIQTGMLKTDLTWYQIPHTTWRTGLKLERYHSNPGNLNLAESGDISAVPEISEYYSLGISAYLSNELKLGSQWEMKTGIRFSSWRNLGPSTVYFYDENYAVIDTVKVGRGKYFSPYFKAEPRISVTYKPTATSSFTAGYTRTVQYLQMLSNSTSPFTSLEVWLPSGPVIKPQTADQVTLGYFKSFGKVLVNPEIFYKTMENQIDYMDHANMLFNPLIEGELRFGNAKSYGIEILVRKNEGKLTGWIGYSFSKVLRIITDLNNNREFPSSHDRPHSAYLNVMFSPAYRFDISANWIYMTGSPFTSPIGFAGYNGYKYPVYGDKNNDRYPDYHRLDLSVTFKLNKPDNKYRHSLVLSLYNVYGRSNPFSISYNKIMDDSGNFIVPSDFSGNTEIIPTSISVAGIIPSLNYILRL